MYKLTDLEKIIDNRYKVYQNDELVYNGTSHATEHIYVLENYEIHTLKPVTEEILDLLEIVLRHNENIRPFWHRVIHGKSFAQNEIPDAYGSQMDKSIWLVKGKRVTDDMDIITAMFENSKVFPLNKNMIVVFYLSDEEVTPSQLQAQIEMEAMKSVRIVEGPSVQRMDDMALSFNNALLLDKMVDTEANVIQFKDVIIEQLIAATPDSTAQTLYDNYNALYPIQGITSELVETIYSFFKHNLNITDTANELYLHRNTLIYRLNKIQQMTNLDIKTFEDACKMKVMLLLRGNQVD